jgi:hypothetical protein
VRQCARECAAVRTAVWGSASGSVWQCERQCTACSASGSVRQCALQCVAVPAAVCGCPVARECVGVCGSVRRCAAVRQCAAMRQCARQCVVVWGSSATVCGSASGVVWQCAQQCAAGLLGPRVQALRRVQQCAQQCAAVRQCGTVRHYAALLCCTVLQCAAVRAVRQCDNASGSVWRCEQQQCAAVR